MQLSAEELIALETQFGANNYKPLNIIIEEADGCWVKDTEGKRYLDCLSSYSALNFGHCHPKLLEALTEQANKVTLTSRAFRNSQLPLLYKELHELTGFEMALPMNSGAEAVETAIKAARKWGYQKKGITKDKAEIVVFNNNFHGRTTTIVGFSTEAQYKDGFGPFTPGFKIANFGDADSVVAAINENTCAVMLEAIQGEGGILIPPDGFLQKISAACQKNNVLLIIDEIQTGWARTGKLFAYQHETIDPDVVIVGKALSGGMYPVSAVLASREVLGVFNPGDHGSTFGGNPLGCAVARAALRLIEDEKLIERSENLGRKLLAAIKDFKSEHIVDVRGRGLLVGIELNTAARPYCEQLKDLGMLCKETHETVIRIAPPLVIAEKDLDWAIANLQKVL